MTFTLTSLAFAKRSPIPPRHACDGEDLSPALEWCEAPDSTRSFALIVSDPDAPKGVWYHWGVFDIPAWYTELPEAFPPEAGEGNEDAPVPPDGIRQARNNFGHRGWNGPCPPHHHHLKHHYRFRLMALDVERLELPAEINVYRLERACEAHLLDEATVTGLYHR